MTMLASLMLAVSSTLWARLASCARSSINRLRYRTIAQLALRRGGHEARAQPAEFEQLGEPFAVAYIRLAARHHLHMLGIDDGEVAVPLEGYCRRAASRCRSTPSRRACSRRR